MKVFLPVMALFGLLASFSCQKYQCAGFDKEHPINKWNWFPENQVSYSFININQDKIELTRTKYEATQSREFSCDICACCQDLTSHYDIANVGIQFRCTLSYCGKENNRDNDGGGLYYGIDKIGSPFSPSMQTVHENEVPPYEYVEFETTIKDIIDIAGKEFTNVTELSVKDTTKSKIRKLWIAQNSGLVGFRMSNQNWRKE